LLPVRTTQQTGMALLFQTTLSIRAVQPLPTSEPSMASTSSPVWDSRWSSHATLGRKCAL
jgi:hypothetical protein